jgi:hypothetical protein
MLFLWLLRVTLTVPQHADITGALALHITCGCRCCCSCCVNAQQLQLGTEVPTGAWLVVLLPARLHQHFSHCYGYMMCRQLQGGLAARGNCMVACWHPLWGQWCCILLPLSAFSGLSATVCSLVVVGRSWLCVAPSHQCGGVHIWLYLRQITSEVAAVYHVGCCALRVR